MKPGSKAAVALLALALTARAAPNPHLEPLKPFLGKTWRGVFPNSTPDKPVVDVSRFELVLNGQAVRNLHSINDGDYGGESLIVWDEPSKSLMSFYFTTAGFRTVATLTIEDGTLVTREKVLGNGDGIAEARGTFRVTPDGKLHVKTEYLKDGKWVPGREMDYVEDKNAVVRFKD